MKKWLIGGVILILLLSTLAWMLYRSIKAPNIVAKEDTFLYIHKKTSYEELKEILISQWVKNETSFRLTARLMKFSENTVKPGRYKLTSQLSNEDLIRKLRSGDQDPLTISIHNVKYPSELAAMITRDLSIDSTDFMTTLEAYLQENSIPIEEALCLFIPNSYEVFWNVSPTALIERLIREKNTFWDNGGRRKKLKEIGLTECEAYTLASIVHKESNYNPEKPRIAGVYLNRLDSQIPLQADPTVVYANRIFGARRVLFKHLEYDSPYNTYKYSGLPPGPIYMPSIVSLEAVLNPEDHEYYYFCADPDAPGQHVFARTLRQHNINAARYRRAIFQE